MKKIGFTNSKMKEEDRIALLPPNIKNITNPDQLYFQKYYGLKCGFDDDDYRKAGANIVSEEEAYSFDVLCIPKFFYDDANFIKENQTIFGWLHLVKDESDTIKIIDKKGTAIAWEHMFKDGKNIFFRNGELTGKIGIIHSIPYTGKAPETCYTSVIGRGRVGTAAIHQLRHMGVKDVNVYHSQNSYLLKDKIGLYDLIVNCSCSDNIILSKEDISNMKKGALLVDLGSGGIDVGNKQSIYSPVHEINDGKNLCYRINHIPTLWFKTASQYISEDVTPYINMLIKEESCETLNNAVVIDKGNLLVDRLNNR